MSGLQLDPLQMSVWMIYPFKKYTGMVLLHFCTQTLWKHAKPAARTDKNFICIHTSQLSALCEGTLQQLGHVHWKCSTLCSLFPSHSKVIHQTLNSVYSVLCESTTKYCKYRINTNSYTHCTAYRSVWEKYFQSVSTTVMTVPDRKSDVATK